MQTKVLDRVVLIGDDRKESFGSVATSGSSSATFEFVSNTVTAAVPKKKLTAPVDFELSRRAGHVAI